jgi:hypothetical protein
LFGNFALFLEYDNAERLNSLYFVSLVALDFYNVTFEKLHTLEYSCSGVEILVNKFDSTNFVLRLWTDNGYVARICKINKKSILVGDPIYLPRYFESYFGGFLYYIGAFGEVENDWIEVYFIRSQFT